MGLALGPAFGTLVGGLMMASLGWRSGFLLVGLSSLLWLIPWLTVTRGAGAEPQAHADDGPAPVVPSFLAILKRRELWGASLGHFSGNYGFYFVVSWLPLYLVKSQGYSISLMAGVGAAIYVTYAVAAFVSGQVTDLWMSRGDVMRVRAGVHAACADRQNGSELGGLKVVADVDQRQFGNRYA